MTATRPRYAATIDAVLVLLEGGRTAMARTVLETLGADVAAAVRHAYADGREDGERDLARQITGTAKPRRAKAPRRHEWLAQRIQDPELRERAKQVLRLDDALLDAIAAGGVGLGQNQWRLLRRELEK
jgi:hypothetical protein